jgi:hypothetical protein
VTAVEVADIRVSPGHDTPSAACPIREDERRSDGEEQSIARVVESLIAMYPAVPEPCVRDCVRHIRAGFATAPIRTYIPILVARQARAALITLAATAGDARVG